MKSFCVKSFLFLFFSCFNLSSLAKQRTSLKASKVFRPSDSKASRPSDRISRERVKIFKNKEKPLFQDRKEELSARGLVVRFHRWPSRKNQRQIFGVLKASGLKRTKSIKSFKAQLFAWEEGGLKPSSLAEQACVQLRSLSYVRRCSPDHLLSPGLVNEDKKESFNFQIEDKSGAGTDDDLFLRKLFLAKANQSKKSETEAGFNAECEGCNNQNYQGVAETAEKLSNIRTCNIISHKQELMVGELSDYWAQELIGSDLLREELEKTSPPKIENWIAVFDTKQEAHNIFVKNLISDEGDHAVLPELEKRRVSFLETDTASQTRKDYEKGKGYKPALSLYETSYPGDYIFGFKKRSPHYINNSMGWRESEDIYEVFNKLSSSGSSRSIVVVSSGNNFPDKLANIKSKASRDFDAIMVGSFSPRGFVSDFSQSGKEVHILAPSDDWITSAGKEGEYRQFGGTSGAAPLVTGALAGFEWLSGYHPTAKEAKLLLEKTAFPTLHSHEKAHINGVGLLNAYKLGEVAKRLKEKCKKNTFCFENEILKEENYRFSEDKSLKRDLGRLFPTCSLGEALEESSSLSDCGQKAEFFKRLRKAILLNPKEDLLKGLSCIYKEAGFTKNAEALDNLSQALGTEEEIRASLKARLSKSQNVSDDELRLMLGMGGFEEDFSSTELYRATYMLDSSAGLLLLEKVFASGDQELQVEALRGAVYIGAVGLPLLEKGFASGDQELQMEALRGASHIGSAGLPLLEKGFSSGDQELQMEALRGASRIRSAGLPLLEKGFSSGDRELQVAAMYGAGRIGSAGLPLLKKGFSSGDRELQVAAMYGAGRIGSAGLPLLKKGFSSGDQELQMEALRGASHIGSAGLPLLEKGFSSGDQELQMEALRGASHIRSAGLPLLEKGFSSGDRELQVAAMYGAGRIGVVGLPLLEKGFSSGDRELQVAALSGAGRIGVVGLPLLEKGFSSGDRELQEEVLFWAGNMGARILPLFKKMLNSPNLDEDIKEDIQRVINRF